MNNKALDDLIRRAQQNTAFRKYLVAKDHFLFGRVYFSKQMYAPSAAFQREMFHLAASATNTLVVAAFRGSGKSLTFTWCYPLYAIMTQDIHYILIFGGTQRQAEMHLAKIRRFLEKNALFKKDFGPLGEESSKSAIVIPRFNAKIEAVSSEGQVRGMTYEHYRPQLLIADDVEDLNSVRTQENRDKAFHYLQSEIIPLGEPGTRIIVVGNLLHPDSSIMRLKEAIEKKKIDGVFRKYPLQDEDGSILWPERYTPKVFEAERRKFTDDIDFQREMNLRFVFASDTVVRPEWIHRYPKLPDGGFVREFVIGVDPAIGLKQPNCYTAIVSVVVCNRGDEMKLYVYPDPFNKRVNFPDTLEEIKKRYEHLRTGMRPVRIFIEDIYYQRSLPQYLQLLDKLPAEGFHMPMDPRGRYSVVGDLCRREKIVFPETGCELLITQLTGFGNGERHDDLASALALIAFAVFPDPYPKFKVPSIMGWPGKQTGDIAVDDSEIRAVLRDPEQRKELEKQADLEVTEEQLRARGYPGYMAKGISSYKHKKGSGDYPRKFTF